MAEEDIYGSKKKYERFLERLEALTVPPETDKPARGTRKYYCKNKSNLEYFGTLHKLFESRDTSYVRRMRVFDNLLMVTSVTHKDLVVCEREDLNEIVAFAQTVLKSCHSKSDFIKRLRFVWKHLFPEKDEKGRVDETIVPYTVRHLSSKIDKSKQKLRNDRLTFEEFEKIINYFSDNQQMQCYITLAIESFGRPQEMCYCKISDLELHENYARIWISDHGKEGTKFLQCIDSFPYLIKWYEQHPYKQDSNAYLFLTHENKDKPLTPDNINKKLKRACRQLDIQKPITAYSLKRNGITFSRLRGDADVDIQHRAGWKSTDQLKIYDMSNANDCFNKQLAKRGLLNGNEYEDLTPKNKECICGTLIGFAERTCPRCKRLTDTKEIKKNLEAEKEMKNVFALALQHPEMSFIEIMDRYRIQQPIIMKTKNF